MCSRLELGYAKDTDLTGEGVCSLKDGDSGSTEMEHDGGETGTGNIVRADTSGDEQERC